MAEVGSGYFTNCTFESNPKDKGNAEEYSQKSRFCKKSNTSCAKSQDAKFIGNFVEDFYAANAKEMKVLFSKGGKMKVLNKEVVGDTIYLEVEEVQ